MKIARAFPVFSATFAILYAFGTFGSSLLVYYPKVNVWHFGGRLPRGGSFGTPSQWYGWTVDALVGALIVSALYLLIPRAPRVPGVVSWVVPIAMMLVVIYVIAKLFWIR